MSSGNTIGKYKSYKAVYQRCSYDKQENKKYWWITGYYIGVLPCTFAIYGPYNGRKLTGHIECRYNGRYYTKPITKHYTQRGIMQACAYFINELINP